MCSVLLISHSGLEMALYFSIQRENLLLEHHYHQVSTRIKIVPSIFLVDVTCILTDSNNLIKIHSMKLMRAYMFWFLWWHPTPSFVIAQTWNPQIVSKHPLPNTNLMRQQWAHCLSLSPYMHTKENNFLESTFVISFTWVPFNGVMELLLLLRFMITHIHHEYQVSFSKMSRWVCSWSRR